MVKIPVEGTRVKLDLSGDKKSWASKGFKHGDEVKLVRYETIHYGRTQSFAKSGIYLNESYGVVENKDGIEKEFYVDAFSEIPGISLFREKKTRSEKRLSDLPETKFWEGDSVANKNGEVFSISSVNFFNNAKVNNDGIVPVISYIVSKTAGVESSRFECKENQLTLVERGNVWKHFNGEELKFDTIKDEIDFHILISEVEYLKNPYNERLPGAWNTEDILEVIRSGVADYADKKPHVSVYKFDDSKIGEMAREYWINENDPEHHINLKF